MRNHMTDELPQPDDGESFFGRTTGFLYKKYVIDFPAANLLTEMDFIVPFLARTCHLSWEWCDGECESECQFEYFISEDEVTFYCTGLHALSGEGYVMELGFRVFARLGSDTVTFICAEMNVDEEGRSMFWTEDALKKACEYYFGNRMTEPLVSMVTTPCDRNQFDMEEFSIRALSHPVIGCILCCLDLDSQFRASRVCALWRILYRHYVNNRHILIDLSAACGNQPQNSDLLVQYHDCLMYKLVNLLQRILSKQTHTLALTDNQKSRRQSALVLKEIMSAINTFAQAKKIRLPRLIVKNCRYSETSPLHSFLAIKHCSHANRFECASLSQLMSVCDQLMLINFDASSALVGSAELTLLTGDETNLPEFERAFWREFPPDDFRICIPFLQFKSTETPAEQCRMLLAAANDRCPIVSPRVNRKVAAIHARWVHRLNYPEQWARIRIFLKLFNCLRLNDNVQRWDALDLRELNIGLLTNVTYAVLNACYEDLF
ncbi:uncharacterized protein LOC129596885 [Paramacrobiotus metropolitanus]|uniref:uncharacterized protein LOC129596885 n=1 Tax=Paramacrobiotus metropolitanus TaxID=2943436 RepID=UPI002445BABA|nr:uncharacterized protein LOC129596885 [Paramacrobiotus metropolitanus]